MNVLVVGAGAVGLGLASCLLKSGAGVDLVGREETVSALKGNGLVRTGIFGDYTVPPNGFEVYDSVRAVPEKRYDYLVICAKSFDSRATAEEIADRPDLVGENTKIVHFQNGWGNAEIFAGFFPQSRVYSGRVITGFRRPEPNHVVVTVHADSIHVGSLHHKDSSAVEDLCLGIRNGGIPCTTTESIGKDLWAKMLYNCALNPLGAVLNVPYGVLGEWEPTRRIMNGIIEEVFEVMTAAGYSTHWNSPDGYLEIFYGKERFLRLPSMSRRCCRI